MVNSSYTYAVFGMAAYTFAIGGLLIWVPNYLFTTRGLEPGGRAALGVVTLAAALIGMTVGGWLSDRLAKTRPGALFVVPWPGHDRLDPVRDPGPVLQVEPVIFGSIFLAEALMFVNTGPCNAIIAHVVQPNLRAAAYAISVVAVHFLGDIWSATLIGKAADLFGDPEIMNSSIGRALRSIGAVPTQVAGQRPENIVAGLLCVTPALLLSGLVLIAGARHLAGEMALMRAKLKAAPARPGAAPDLA